MTVRTGNAWRRRIDLLASTANDKTLTLPRSITTVENFGRAAALPQRKPKLLKRKPSVPVTHKAAATVAAFVAAELAIAAPAYAQSTVDIPAGTNLNSVIPPANGDVWTLLGPDIFLANGAVPLTAIAFPQGTPGLTINGNGNTITLNDGAGHFGRFLFGSGTTTVALNDVTITGGSDSAIRGTITNALLTVNGNVGFTNNASTAQGGAISTTTGSLTMNGNVNFTGNTAVSRGGAVYAPASVSITGDASFLNNAAGDQGGAIYSTGAVTVTGNVNLTGNTSIGAGAGGGGIYGAAISLGTTAGSNVVLSGNSTSATAPNGAGGAINSTAGRSRARSTKSHDHDS